MDASHDKVRGAADRRYLYLRNDRPDIPYAQEGWYMEISPVTAEGRRLHAAGALRFPQDLYMAERKPAEELYDKLADPWCVFNLAERADHADVLRRMREALKSWCERTGDLGETPERELVARGVIDDQIAEFTERVAILPEAYRAGGVYDNRYDPDRV